MEHLTHSEINEGSVIVIELEDGTTELFLVGRKGKGGITEATILLGHRLSVFLDRPDRYPGTSFTWERFYIENDEKSGKDKRVKFYRRVTPAEKEEWEVKLKPIEKLHPLLEAVLIG